MSDIETGGFAADRLRSLVERIERLEEEKKGICLDIRKSFADGFYIKIAKRLEDFVEQRKAETKKATGTDLVVLNAENLENAFNEDFNTTLKTGRARRPRNFDPVSFVAGTQKGKEFRILDEVTNEDGQNR